MPRYFFHVRDGRNLIDRQGTELSDLTAARGEAGRLTAEHLHERRGQPWGENEWVMRVTDADYMPLFQLTIFYNRLAVGDEELGI